jgi:hydroxymethylbilane synthase
LGTRGSKLARWQADWVAGQLRQLGHAVDVIEISTRGDTEDSAAIGSLGTVGVFTKEVQRALVEGAVDLAVHSLKDLPTEVTEGLVLAAVPARESPADVLVSNLAQSLADLPRGSRVGTGSLRRQAQLRHVRHDLLVEDIRGNVDTRLRKLDEGQFDAIVLAEAGLRRLGLAGRISEVLSPEVMLSAVGQGALAIECRADDRATATALNPIDDPATRAAVLAERALLAQLRGGCLAPVGAWGRIEGSHLSLSAVVLSVDGSHRIKEIEVAPAAEAETLGRRVADALLSRGAAQLIASARTA